MKLSELYKYVVTLLQTSFLDLQGYCIFRCYDEIAKEVGRWVLMSEGWLSGTRYASVNRIPLASGSRISCFSARHLLRSRVPVSHLSASSHPWTLPRRHQDRRLLYARQDEVDSSTARFAAAPLHEPVWARQAHHAEHSGHLHLTAA